MLLCAAASDKRGWLSCLATQAARPGLERALDAAHAHLRDKHPLRLPPATLYRFAEPDGPHNIVLEPKSTPPAIRGATLLKLVERLTYHVYADLVLVRTFLTTYRSFCEPRELLRLLKERFDIPPPEAVYGGDAENMREDWKRYRKEFEQPVRFRVINVLRHWVDQHYYDFERDPELLADLKGFLSTLDGRPVKRWAQGVLKLLARRAEEAAGGVVGFAHVFVRPPPPPLAHVAPPAKHDWHPLALHPLELARQLALLHSALYRRVRPAELVGAVWTTKDKHNSSPNLLKMIHHTTNLTRWMERCVVDADNLEERAAVLSRWLQLACALRDLNDFNGVLAVVAATAGAAVHRLRHTHALVSPRLLRDFDRLRSLNADHFRRYQERLRSINPPCVPFLGVYLTNILHIEEGNLDFLPDTELINFSKRRMVAEITGEIQQYQNQPYCLTVEPETRAFLERLDPFPAMDDNEITNYLYARSLHVEPRGKDKPPAKFVSIRLRH